MYRERKIIVSKVLTYSYNEPKQERSKARFNEVLKTAEFILMNKGAYNLTVQDISRLSGMKRPSIYKFFPSNESILEALSIQQARSLQNLIYNNLKNSSKESLLESIKVIIWFQVPVAQATSAIVERHTYCVGGPDCCFCRTVSFAYWE